MISKKTSISLHEDLHAGAVAQAAARGYPSVSAYLVALLRLDTINDADVDHDLGRRIGEMVDRKRDLIDARVKEKAEEALAQWAFVAEPSTESLDQLVSGSPASPVLQFPTAGRGRKGGTA